MNHPKACLILLLVAPTFGIAQTLDARIDAARALRLNSHVEESIATLGDIILEHPDDFRATYNLGLGYAAAGQDPQALEAFAKAASLREQQNADDISIYNTYGWQLLRTGNPKLAIVQFEKGIQHKDRLSASSKSRLVANYGLALMQDGRYADAEHQLRIAATELGNPIAKRNLELLLSQQRASSWAVVMGADKTSNEANFEVKRAKKAGIDGAETVLRSEFYRTIAVFEERTAAEAALTQAQAFRPDAYLVRMETWCGLEDKDAAQKTCHVANRKSSP